MRPSTSATAPVITQTPPRRAIDSLVRPTRNSPTGNSRLLSQLHLKWHHDRATLTTPPFQDATSRRNRPGSLVFALSQRAPGSGYGQTVRWRDRAWLDRVFR